MGDAFTEVVIEVDDAQGKPILMQTHPSTEEVTVANERIANVHPWSNYGLRCVMMRVR